MSYLCAPFLKPTCPPLWLRQWWKIAGVLGHVRPLSVCFVDWYQAFPGLPHFRDFGSQATLIATKLGDPIAGKCGDPHTALFMSLPEKLTWTSEAAVEATKKPLSFRLFRSGNTWDEHEVTKCSNNQKYLLSFWRQVHLLVVASWCLLQLGNGTWSVKHSDSCTTNSNWTIHIWKLEICLPILWQVCECQPTVPTWQYTTEESRCRKLVVPLSFSIWKIWTIHLLIRKAGCKTSVFWQKHAFQWRSKALSVVQFSGMEMGLCCVAPQNFWSPSSLSPA